MACFLCISCNQANTDVNQTEPKNETMEVVYAGFVVLEQIDTIQNNTFVNFRVPGELGKPDTGSIIHQLILEIV